MNCTAACAWGSLFTEYCEGKKDNEALEAAKLLGKRLIELETILGGK